MNIDLLVFLIDIVYQYVYQYVIEVNICDGRCVYIELRILRLTSGIDRYPGGIDGLTTLIRTRWFQRHF
jgi:hypothetical protein